MTTNSPIILDPDRDRIVAMFTVVAGVTLYGLSLFADSFYIESPGPKPVAIFPLLMFGYMASFSWFANPLLVFSWFALPQRQLRQKGLLALILAIILSLLFLTNIGNMILTGEGGGSHRRIIGVGRGYWLWTGSIAVTFLGGLVSWAIGRDETNLKNSVHPPVA